MNDEEKAKEIVALMVKKLSEELNKNPEEGIVDNKYLEPIISEALSQARQEGREEQMQYSIALQRLIERYCRGSEITVLKECPHHSEMLMRKKNNNYRQGYEAGREEGVAQWKADMDAMQSMIKYWKIRAEGSYEACRKDAVEVAKSREVYGDVNPLWECEYDCQHLIAKAIQEMKPKEDSRG